MSVYHDHTWYVLRDGAYVPEKQAPSPYHRYYLCGKPKKPLQQQGWTTVWYYNGGGYQQRTEMPINELDIPKEIQLFLYLED
jgi:hypothetical protein